MAPMSNGLIYLIGYGKQDIYLTKHGKMVTICHRGCACYWSPDADEPIIICKIKEHVEVWTSLFRDQSKTTNVLPKDMFELIKKYIEDHPNGNIYYISKGEYKESPN